MRKRKQLAAALFFLLLPCCKTMGPFAKSITSQGDGTLVIQWTEVSQNWFTGTVREVRPTVTVVRVR